MDFKLSEMNPGNKSLICDGYRNDPKFSDRQVWANSADLDQTAPTGAV